MAEQGITLHFRKAVAFLHFRLETLMLICLDRHLGFFCLSLAALDVSFGQRR